MAGSLVRRAAPLAVALVAAFAAGQVYGQVRAADSPYVALDVFARVLTQIAESYVDPLSQKDLVYRALDGVDDALDPHSRFLDPESFRRLREDAEGQFVGIGAQLREDPCGLRVTGVLSAGPADRAGIMADDCLVTVDGSPLAGLALDEALGRVRGLEGEAVTLGVSRDGGVRPIPVLRTRIVEASVEGELFSAGIALLRVRQFRAGAATELAARVAELGAQAPIRGAVLDLRDNPGGRLDEAVAITDLFLGSGRIVSTRARAAGQPEELHDATDSRDDWAWPLVVLVNGQSASAAEIVAGALQDHGRAKLVGTPTYGKGSVQTVYEFEDGSALKLTIARYYLPSGRRIEDHRGLTPDIAAAPQMLPSPVDRLRTRVATSPALAAPERTELLELVDALPDERAPAPVDRTGRGLERLSRDPQLAAAWKALRDALGER